MNHSATSPSLFCHKMSVLPSLLKSPDAIACQPGRLGSCSVPALCPSDISHSPCTPVEFSQAMSVLPSLLKSPEAIGCHVKSQAATKWSEIETSRPAAPISLVP